MKKYLLLSGILLSSLSGFAQHTSKYDISVFNQHTTSGNAFSRSQMAKKTSREKDWQAMLPGWAAGTDKVAGTLRNMFGAPVTLPGNTIAAKATYCLDNVMPSMGISKSHLISLGINETPVGTMSRYLHTINGRQVVFSSLTLRFTKAGELAGIQNKYYGNITSANSPSISAEEALIAAKADLNSAILSTAMIDNDWKWFPVPANGHYELHPAYGFQIAGKDRGSELQLNGYIDAVTGKILYRTNHVKETLDATIVGNVYKDNPTQPITTEPLANLRINVGGNFYYTDSAGNLNLPSVTLPDTSIIYLRGLWSNVRASANSNVTPTDTLIATTVGIVDTFTDATPSSLRHVNAYYHVNRVHDFMKGFFPTFTSMDIALTTNVDVTSGTCNAFYNPGNTTINFYQAGGGCNSFAECGDIVYHEYGHAISDKFYAWQNVGDLYNGAMDEGNSDIWAISITHNPVIGLGSSVAPGANIRRYDQTPKVYPADIQGEVHADGEIIAGAWWDVAVNIGNVDTMANIFAKTYFLTPDGPNGTEGEVYFDVLIAALTVDDNDNNILNGTPHFSEIVTAFARHGIYLLSDMKMTSGEPANQPADVTIPVTGTYTVSYPVFLKELKLIYKPRGNQFWDTAAVIISGNSFSSQIPAQPRGTIVDYYIAAYDTTGGGNVYLPEGYIPGVSSSQTTLPYQFGVGLIARYVNDFETDVTGWEIGNVAGDNATGGVWTNAVPVGSYVTTSSGTATCQPGFDNTTGTGKCLVTENAASSTADINAADVDRGITTVITPALDITGFETPVIEYYRWYSNDLGNNKGNDIWKVNMRDASSTSWFVTVDQTYISDYHWRRRIFAIKDYLSTSTSIQLRFQASDNLVTNATQNGQSTVEAAIDDFIIYDKAFPAGVNEEVASLISVYPNPANDQLIINMTPDNHTGTLALYDITGKKIAEQTLEKNKQQYRFQVMSLPAGHYTLLINSNHSIQSKGITIAH